MMSNILENSKEIQSWLVNLRRDFHRHPEPSLEEIRTSKIIEEQLIKMGIKIERVCETGIIGILEGKDSGKVIALRADMDALSVTEKTDLPFASETPGLMHACGHDFHVSMLLGAAKLLSQMTNEFNGTVKFIFQPAEELALGAKNLIKNGVLKNPDVDFVFGMHIWSDVPVNKVVVQQGALMAGADTWNLTITGKSAHGSSPWQGKDAIVCAATVIQSLQTIVSRTNDVRSPIVINIGTIKGGERFNVIPGSVQMEGMNRTFSSDTREKLPQWIEKIVKSTCEAYDCEYEFSYNPMTAVVINDEKGTKLVKNSLAKILGEDAFASSEKIMGSEDFSEYLEQVPGVLMLLGGRNEEKGCCYSQHSNFFDVDEDALPIGTASYVQVALDYLK
ncbi:amidohydrolase [uncultured Clostridium sp.]|uniref:M20 metallopeptidase family protein n=1 Tax=uncultured Clostridium sp. TaxID=59620 RepID=UPI0028E1D56A|nr:amidohydrolase [uncultured Clostridium sp.]